MPQSAQQGQTPGAIMDQEHRVQTGLAQALVDALEGSGNADQAGEILDQLVAYSSAHFMSEELLMRLASYDDYDDHVADHIRMMDELNGVLAGYRAGETAAAAAQVRALQAFLGQHIQTRDSRFAACAPV